MKRLLCWILSLCLLLCLVPGASAAEQVTGMLERRAGYDLASVRCELADGSYFFASVEETAAGYAYAFDSPSGTYTVKPEYFSTTVWDGAVDISWYDASQTVFSIDTPAKLAGLAALVNGQVDAGTPDYRIKGDRSKQGYIDDVIGLISPVVAELATMFRRIERGEVDLFGDKKE